MTDTELKREVCQQMETIEASTEKALMALLSIRSPKLRKQVGNKLLKVLREALSDLS